jgi:hypothetical protein
LASFGYIFVAERRERHEREQKDQLTRVLAKATVEPVVFGEDGLRSARATHLGPDERVRAALIKAAVARRPVRTVLDHLPGTGLSERDLLDAVATLASSGLLRFDPPLGRDSILELED